MDVVPPAGAVCARLGSKARIADTATMPAVIANAKPRPVKLDFEGIVDSSLSDTRQHNVGLADELIQRTLGKRPVIVVNFISSYSSQFISVNRATGKPVAPLDILYGDTAPLLQTLPRPFDAAKEGRVAFKLTVEPIAVEHKADQQSRRFSACG